MGTASTGTERATTTQPFEPPGPGSWELDLSHYSPDCSRVSRDIIEASFRTGLEEGMDLVGSPVRAMEAVFINGWFYRRIVPLVGGDRDLPPPPAWLLKVVTRLHPEFRRRNTLAAKVMDERGWMDELDRWEREWKPELIEQNRAFASVDVTSLDDVALAAHVEDLAAHLTRTTTLHFRLHVSDLGPIGLLLVWGRERGIDPIRLMSALAGFSTATSEPVRALAAIATHLDGPVGSFDEVRAAGPEAAEALDDYLIVYGSRLTGGYDFQEPTLAELPDTVLAAINNARTTPADGEADQHRARGEARADTIRAELDPSDRTEFDRLLADARALYALRDENGPLTYQWPGGVLRGAMLDAGRRLAANGRLSDEAHVFDLAATEIGALLRNESIITADRIGRRYDARMTWSDLDAPRYLGPEPFVPPADVLPPALATLMDVVLTVTEMIESAPERAPMQGVGIGDTPYVGRARVVDDALDALGTFEPGEVLVVPYTVPTINSVLAMAGAVVAEEGGLLCHAAVIARELDIAGVVGVDGATSTIPNGAEVEVDPSTGTIRLL